MILEYDKIYVSRGRSFHVFRPKREERGGATLTLMKTNGAHTESISIGPELIYILPGVPRKRETQPSYRRHVKTACQRA